MSTEDGSKSGYRGLSTSDSQSGSIDTSAEPSTANGKRTKLPKVDRVFYRRVDTTQDRKREEKTSVRDTLRQRRIRLDEIPDEALEQATLIPEPNTDALQDLTPLSLVCSFSAEAYYCKPLAIRSE